MGYNVVSHSFQSYAGMAWQKESGWKIIARLKTYDISLTNELFKFHWIEPIHWMNIGYFILHPFCVCVLFYNMPEHCFDVKVKCEHEIAFFPCLFTHFFDVHAVCKSWTTWKFMKDLNANEMTFIYFAFLHL